MEDSRTLIFYSKADCPLCDVGLEKVERLAARYRLAVRKVDIEADPALLEKHRWRIPVVFLGSEEIGWGRLSERALDRQLAAVFGKPA